MEATKEKISLRQAMFLFLLITYSPALKLIPSGVAKISKQASWLVPVVTFVCLLPVIFALKCMFAQYREKTFSEILEVVFGRFAGKLITFIYVLHVMLLLSINTKNVSERLTTTIYPSVNTAFFILVMLVGKIRKLL
jgi:hypothetical protein